MVSGNTSEELPPDWKESVKVKNGRKIKYFTNLATGQKFYSKRSVIRFVNSMEIYQGSSPSNRKPDNGSRPCKSNVTTDVVKTSESPVWLPRGWTVESRTRKSGSSVGSVYKIYTDPLTGCKFYSKPQVMQYLQGIEHKNAAGKQQMQISEESSLKQQDMSQHCKSMEGKINLSGENKNGMCKPALKIVCSDVEENNGSDKLPPGRTKKIKTRKRGHRIRKGLQDTSQACQMEGKNPLSGENENDMDKHSLKIDCSDVQEKNGSDELPLGWIKETRTRKCGPGMRKDPYYIDTTSGYVFRSKKDVMRYLETGDIHCCVIKPQKRDISQLTLIKEETHPSSPPDGNKSGESAARRQLFVGHKPEKVRECSQTSTIAAAEAESSKEKEGDSISEKSKETESNGMLAFATKFTGSTIEEMHLGSGAIECDKSGENSGPKAERPKQDIKIAHDNVALNSTEANGFHEQKLTENCLDTKTTKDTRKFKKRKPTSVPSRSSKRLAGHEPEMLPNFSLTERALRAAVKKPHEVEADRSSSSALNTAADEVPQQPVTQAETTRSSSLAMNTVANEVPQQPVTEMETTRLSSLALHASANEVPQQPVTGAETAVAEHTSVCTEASLETHLKNNIRMPSENEVLQPTTGQVSVRQVEENPVTQGDYWSDPCWDFAFKTLTGVIPLEDTLALQSCFLRQTGTSYAQENLTFGLPEFEIPAIFQSDVPQTDSVQNNVPANQLSANPAVTAAGNISLPGCSSQPPSLEARSKDYQTKVKS